MTNKSKVGGLLAVVAVLAAAGAVYQWKNSAAPEIKAARQEHVSTQSEIVERYDDGLEVGPGAIATGVDGLPPKAVGGTRAGKLQAVVFVDRSAASDELRAAVDGLSAAGWIVAENGMVHLVDADRNRTKLLEATGGRQVRVPHVVVYGGGRALRRFDAVGMDEAKLGNALNEQQAALARLGLRMSYR